MGIPRRTRRASDNLWLTYSTSVKRSYNEYFNGVIRIKLLTYYSLKTWKCAVKWPRVTVPTVLSCFTLLVGEMSERKCVLPERDVELITPAVGSEGSVIMMKMIMIYNVGTGSCDVSRIAAVCRGI